MSFYGIANKGFAIDELQAKIENFKPKKDKHLELLESMLTAEQLAELQRSKEHMASIFKSSVPPRGDKTVLAYHASARWLPFFDVNLCEGFIASSKDAKRLSQIFEAPVLALALFDSDVFFVSYCDAERGIRYDFAKPNSDEIEEFDAQQYKTSFPEFLLEFCPAQSHEQLHACWEEQELVDADDRMEKIADLLSFAPLYSSDELPEGFQPIYCS